MPRVQAVDTSGLVPARLQVEYKELIGGGSEDEVVEVRCKTTVTLYQADRAWLLGWLIRCC